MNHRKQNPVLTQIEPLFGKCPRAVTHWSCRRNDDGLWSWLRFPAADGVELSEWPLAELSVETLRERWGIGTYRVLWLAYKNGRRAALGHGRMVSLTSTADAPSLAPDERPHERAPSEGPLAQQRPPASAGVASPSDPVSAVVQLWGVAQNQAHSFAEQYRADAERAVERERVYYQAQVEQQKVFWGELDRIRREAHERATGELGHRLTEAIGQLGSRLSSLSTGLPTRDADGDEIDAPPESLGVQVLQAVAPLCADGINRLLCAVASKIGSTGQHASSPTALSRQAPELGGAGSDPRVDACKDDGG